MRYKASEDLEKRLKSNRKNFNIESPFYGECVIIDEVHNFVSRVINGSKIAEKIYELIYYAKNCKLLCLSGTPLINKPLD